MGACVLKGHRRRAVIDFVYPGHMKARHLEERI